MAIQRTNHFNLAALQLSFQRLTAARRQLKPDPRQHWIRHKLPSMENLTIGQQIRAEIYRAFELLGAGRELLAAIGSWGETLDDKEILRLLKEWNAEEARRGKLASNWF